MNEAVTAESGRKCGKCGAALPPGVDRCGTCGTIVAAAAVITTPGGPAVPAPGQTDLAPGETLMGQWTLESKLGEGGMGNVFLATELKLGRKVAVKALFVSNLLDETVKRFEREAQVMGKLDHPNIVTLYAVGRHREIPFLVMRYLEGGSLWDLLDANGGRLLPDQLVPLVKQLCAALGYIHSKALIHRDLKPSNIFISPAGKVTVLDLGLARGRNTTLTRTGIIWGTPDFMAPEQIVGEKQLDGRADLYALGVVLYRMISNQPPFPDQDEQQLLRAHLTRPRPDLSKVWAGASPALGLMLQKAMAIKPEERFQTAEEFAAAFERAALLREQSTRASNAVQPVTLPAGNAAARADEEDERTAIGLTAPEPAAVARANADELGDDDATLAVEGDSPPEGGRESSDDRTAIGFAPPSADAPSSASSPSLTPVEALVPLGSLHGDNGATRSDRPAVREAARPTVGRGTVDEEDGLEDQRTVIGLPQEAGAQADDGASTAPARPIPVLEDVPRAPTPSPRPKPSVSVSSSTSKPRRELSARTKLPPRQDESSDSPAWLHPYVLVVGGLLLLALGFLIGVLLR
jgi:serine/threonine protein kinase